MSPIVLAIALTLMLLTTPPTAAAPSGETTPRAEFAGESVSVPMNLETGRIVIDVRINGQGPYPFILDTGAQGSVIDVEAAREMKLTLGAARQVGSPGGASLEAFETSFGRLEIGALTVHQAPAVALPKFPLPPGPTPPRGVLSVYALGEVLITLDYPRAQVVFRRGALGEPDNREVFGWESQRLPEVYLEVAGQRVKAHLDSGFPGGVQLPSALETKLPLAAPAVEMGRLRLLNRELPLKGATLSGTVSLGRYTLENPSVTFADILPDTGNVGGGILRQFAVTIDPLHRRLRLAGPADGRLKDAAPRGPVAPSPKAQ